MDPLQPVSPPAAVVRPAVLEKLAECRALSAGIKTRNRQTAADMARLGRLLAEIKEEVGWGNFGAFLEKNAPDIPERTARRWMAVGKTATAVELADSLDATTHAGTDDGDDTSGESAGNPPVPDIATVAANGGQNDAGQNAGQQPAAPPPPPPPPPGPKKPADWSKEYRNRVFGLKITYPKLANKLIDGTATMPADELWKLTAWMCRRCVRLGPPPVKLCDTCAANRKQKQTDLLQQTSEPADPDDPTSPPEKPADRLARLRKLVIATQREATTALNDPAEECVRLRELLTACRVVDYQGGSPRFRALSGVARVVELAAKPDASPEEVAHQYRIASGEFVPPVFERKKRRGA